MSLAAFAGEVLRRGNAGPAFRREAYPLRLALEVIRQSPDTPQSVALAKLIVALATGEGTFRELELFLFDADPMGFAADLIIARTDGGLLEPDWQAARFQSQMVLRAPDRA